MLYPHTYVVVWFACSFIGFSYCKHNKVIENFVFFLETATWVSRYPSDDNLAAIEASGVGKGGNLKDLAATQRDKFGHFFTYMLDHDKDGFISRKDFRIFSEVFSSSSNCKRQKIVGDR